MISILLGDTSPLHLKIPCQLWKGAATSRAGELQEAPVSRVYTEQEGPRCFLGVVGNSRQFIKQFGFYDTQCNKSIKVSLKIVTRHGYSLHTLAYLDERPCISCSTLKVIAIFK